jgi:hypothetical protein
MYNNIEVWSVDAWGTVRDSIENSGDTSRWDDLGI